jgi:hypothetical protein
MRKGPAILLFLGIFAVTTPLVIALLFVISGKPSPFGGPPPPEFRADVAPLLRQYCYDCHGDGSEDGGISLDSHSSLAILKADQPLWQRVLENLENGVMPPPDAPQPAPEQIALIGRWIDEVVFHHDCNNPDPGRVTIRRLNREEYNNTIRDLVGVRFRPADDFPADDSGYGFDNIGDVLSLSPVLLEKYLRAAKQVMDAALPTEPDNGQTKRLTAKELKQRGSGRLSGDTRALISSGEIYGNFDIREEGEYLIRFSAHGTQAGDEPVRTEIKLDDKSLKQLDVPQKENNPGIFDHRVRLTPGRHKFSTLFINDYYNAKKREDRNYYVHWIEISGPIRKRPETHFQKQVFAEPITKQNRDELADKIIAKFARDAFRRPVGDDEVARLTEFVDLAMQNGDSFEAGIKLALQAVLVSPHFLFRGELQPDPDDKESVHEIDEHALAARLSYFLWSSMPDMQLTRLANEGRLRDQLPKQLKRMLSDIRSQALAKNFAGQWLQLRNLDLVRPNDEKFPAYDDSLRRAMQIESEMLFSRIQNEDRSILEFVTADYTHVNERLARHYGIKGITGRKFVEVSLRDTNRRGILSHASVLTITSHPDRTSAVKRGQWVLNNILGTPPPPAPDDVPTLEDQGRKLTGSLREQLEQHRENKICASCHKLMDPIGFGLENFDAIGRWRDTDEGGPIDSSGELNTGDKFNGPLELSGILAGSRRELFVRNLTRTMLTYALGRGLEHYDKCAVKEITAHVKANDYRFSALVEGIVNSVPFQMRRGEETNGP